MRLQVIVDYDCPEVQRFFSDLYDDPMSDECPCLGEISEGWKVRHRKTCRRCRDFGTQGGEVE
jgi:hypothetical protein